YPATPDQADGHVPAATPPADPTRARPGTPPGARAPRSDHRPMRGLRARAPPCGAAWRQRVHFVACGSGHEARPEYKVAPSPALASRCYASRVPVVSSPAPTVALACPDCRGALAGEPLRCAGCGRVFEAQDGIPVLLPGSLLGDAEQRQHALYAAVAHEYDDVCPR